MVGIAETLLALDRESMNARLQQLYPSGTRLADVKPEFQAIPWREWWMLQIGEQCEAWRRTNPVSAEASNKAEAASGQVGFIFGELYT